jgi:hypothetical protein
MGGILILHLLGASFDWDHIWFSTTSSCRKGKPTAKYPAATSGATNGLVVESVDSIPIPSKADGSYKEMADDPETAMAQRMFKEAYLELQTAMERKYQRQLGLMDC